MRIDSLNVFHCRVLKEVHIELAEDLNVLVGENGSGKTSLLEAISILSTGRSFRTPSIKKVISQGQTSLIINARLNDKEQQSYSIGIQKEAEKTRIRINQSEVYRQSALSEVLPITIIHPDSVSLITGTPASRRSFIDWIAFYLFPDFKSLMKQFNQALKQRNTCLKDSRHRYALDYWTDELIKHQSTIHTYRTQALTLLNEQIQIIAEQIIGTLSVQLSLRSGFSKNIELDSESLKTFYLQKVDSDLTGGRTHSGIHRADLEISMDDYPASQSASRGQLKLISLVLLLAQSNAIQAHTQNSPLILIDDLTAELDHNNQKILFDYLKTINQQLILTTTHAQLSLPGYKMFHVKHGTVQTVS